MKKKISTIGFAIIFLVGLSIMLYPIASNYYNNLVCSKAISSYEEAIENSSKDNDEILEEAREYNSTIIEGESDFISGAPEDKDYIDALNITNGMMGYLKIDKIGVSLPIYHGTDEGVLSVAIGHLEGSSLPTGDVGTHTILSGHTGLPSAKLLTGLDELVEGDTFTLTVLGDVLTYQVRDIYVVLPDDVSHLGVQSDKDLCTLFTCTPYGVNSHRLLVQAERIETPEDYVPVSKDLENKNMLSIIGVIEVLFVIMVVAFLVIKKKKKLKKMNSSITHENEYND